MKIGIPIWEDKISPVLDTASRLLVIETDGKKESSRYETYLEVRGVSHRCFRIQCRMKQKEPVKKFKPEAIRHGKEVQKPS